MMHPFSCLNHPYNNLCLACIHILITTKNSTAKLGFIVVFH